MTVAFIYFLPSRYLCYDPSVPAEDNTSKEIQSEKYAKLISYMEAVGFSNEVTKVQQHKVIARR